jgi:hypothetical protein
MMASASDRPAEIERATEAAGRCVRFDFAALRLLRAMVVLL